MAARPHTNRMPPRSLRPDQALVGVPASEDGQEVTHVFIEDDAEAQPDSDRTLQAALAAIGSWSGPDWDETVAALPLSRR